MRSQASLEELPHHLGHRFGRHRVAAFPVRALGSQVAGVAHAVEQRPHLALQPIELVVGDRLGGNVQEPFELRLEGQPLLPPPDEGEGGAAQLVVVGAAIRLEKAPRVQGELREARLASA